MKTALSLLVLVVFTKCFSQAPIGIGIVTITLDDKPVIDFYKSPTDDVFAKRITFTNDSISKGRTFRDREEVLRWLRPEVLWLDHYELIFRCKSSTDDWYEVVANNENGHTLWIRKDKTTSFSTWEEFLKSMYAIVRIHYRKQKIRAHPTDKSPEIKYEGGDCFRVRSLSGDWIEIYTPTNGCRPDLQTQVKSGWIKWKVGDRMMVDYYTTP
jgi:hypothetical protein